MIKIYKAFIIYINVFAFLQALASAIVIFQTPGADHFQQLVLTSLSIITLLIINRDYRETTADTVTIILKSEKEAK